MKKNLWGLYKLYIILIFLFGGVGCNFFEIEINFSVIKNLLKGKFLKLRNVFKV